MYVRPMPPLLPTFICNTLVSVWYTCGMQANLKEADFTGADLTGASLEGAALDGATFTNAVLQNAYATEVPSVRPSMIAALVSVMKLCVWKGVF